MADADALYKNAGAFTMFERLKANDQVYFNRVIWATGQHAWLGPWATQAKAHDAADFLRFKKAVTLFTIKVTKKAHHG